MILKIVNVDKTFVRTCERSNTFANADERSQKINVNVQNSIFMLKDYLALKEKCIKLKILTEN